MLYRRSDDKIIVRIDRGDSIMEALRDVAVSENISTGFITGIGAADLIEIGCYEISTKEYNRYTFEGDFEITSLTGNFTVKDDEPYIHLHINATDEKGKAFGGHLIDGRISGTCEILVQLVPVPVGRILDETTGINIFDF